MSEETVFTYRHAKAAAARFVQLITLRQGEVQGIDYSRMAMVGCCAPTTGGPQDAALDYLDEFHQLRRMFNRAKGAVGWDTFRAWVYVRIMGHTLGDAAVAEGVHINTVTNRIRRADSAVVAELVERQAIEGYGGRDLLDVSPAYQRGAVSWLNPAAFDEKGEE